MDRKTLLTSSEVSVRVAAREFIRSRARRNCQPSTIETYERTLERFMRWFGHDANLTDIDNRVIRQYTNELVDAKVEVETVDHNLRGLKVFLRWCASEDGDQMLPAAPRVELPKISTKLKRPLVTKEEFAKLLVAMNGKTVWDYRNMAMTALLFDSGARVGEVLGLQTRDIDLDNCVAKVTGKGDKDRYIFFSEFTASLIAKYRARLERTATPNSLFVTNSLDPMTRTATITMLKRAKQRSGVECAVNPHNFRHSFASNYLINGGDVMLLQRMLGHSTLAVTARYAHFKTNDLQESHKTFMASQHIVHNRRRAS